MPISPLAKPRPSTTATITDAPEAAIAEEQLVAAETEKFEHELTEPDRLHNV